MDGGQVRVLKETNEVGLAGFLKSSDRRALESQIRLEVLGNLTDETLEGKLSDQELSRLLVTTDFAESNGPWSVKD
jgi:hypothetical protein